MFFISNFQFPQIKSCIEARTVSKSNCGKTVYNSDVTKLLYMFIIYYEVILIRKQCNFNTDTLRELNN